MSSFVETKKIFPRDDPFPLKFWLQVTYPLLKAASFDTIPACDGRTDGIAVANTALAMRALWRAVKVNENILSFT